MLSSVFSYKVVFYVKRCHKFTVIDEMTKMHEKAFESIFIKIELLNSLCQSITLPLMTQNKLLIISMTTLLILLAN